MQGKKIGILVLFVASIVSSTAHAALISVTYEGTVGSNQITIGPFAGVAVGTVIQYKVILDTDMIYSHLDYETIYRHNEQMDTIAVAGVGTFNGLPEGSPTANNASFRFASNEFDYELTPKPIRLDIAGQPPVNVTLQLNGFDDTKNPFDNSGLIQNNFGVYSAAPSIWDGTRLFLITATGHPQSPTSRSLGVNMTSVTIAAVPEPASLMLIGCGVVVLTARRTRTKQ